MSRYRILQIMPANGWCLVSWEVASAGVRLVKLPLAGFALVHEYRSGRRENQLELDLVYGYRDDDGNGAPETGIRPVAVYQDGFPEPIEDYIGLWHPDVPHNEELEQEWLEAATKEFAAAKESERRSAAIAAEHKRKAGGNEPVA